MNLESALEKIYSMHRFNIKLGLDSIKKLMNYLGNPEKSIKAIHIAGSNGKGSTASFISSILQESEYSVGLYTSPHLVKFNERIRINGQMIPDDYIQKFITDMDKYIRKEAPTFFEITTAMAFKYFAESKIDYAVIETGLGGRLDATNILDPIAAVITTISQEHTNILGNSIEEITNEKAGIIKEGENVFIGLLPVEAKQVILSKSNKSNNKVFKLEKNILITEKNIKFVSNNFEITLTKTPLRGRHQSVNAALSILTAKNTFPNISRQSIEQGIQSVIENTGIQGRYEVIHESPKVIMDSGHNPECISAFTDEFKREYSDYSNRILIFGAMRDKNVGQMLKAVARYFDVIFVTNVNNERAYSAEELKYLSKNNNIEVQIINKPNIYIETFIKSKSDECLVVMGSIYLLGEIKSNLEYMLDNKGILV